MIGEQTTRIKATSSVSKNKNSLDKVCGSKENIISQTLSDSKK